ATYYKFSINNPIFLLFFPLTIFFAMIIPKNTLPLFFILPLFLFSIPTLPKSTDVTSETTNDLGLSSLISKYRVVFFGETNHGVSQQFATIANLSEKMVAENGFELLQSESSFFSTYVELLKKGKPSVQGLSMIYRDTEE